MALLVDVDLLWGNRAHLDSLDLVGLDDGDAVTNPEEARCDSVALVDEQRIDMTSLHDSAFLIVGKI